MDGKLKVGAFDIHTVSARISARLENGENYRGGLPVVTDGM